MRNFFKYLFVLTIGVVCIAAITPAKKIAIWMIGDSTMCLYESSRAPLTGWGMPFAGFFDAAVVTHNHAKGGRSTRTFLSENRWKPVLDSMTAGDYVFIQFGHNDEAKEEKYKDRYTPVAGYKSNLRLFINTAREKRAIPVLITPVSRMRFDNAGTALETHTDYTAAVWEVGSDLQVPVIDLDKESRALIQSMGPKYAPFLFMQLDSMQHPAYPAGLKDNTHFNEYGARRMAQIVLAGVRQQIPELAARIVHVNAKN
ncbi:MAG: rhamnogalacturonan acetylesterase [Chitinophagaceae bacterium]|nr:MAG: rhamnogalacturonan acetylesterase [Chitinophagaceae bacterium]